MPEQTNADNLTPQAIAGKHLWDRHNCMGWHTILGEGAYYAPELTKVYERRGPEFIEAMPTDPHKVKPDTLMPKAPLTSADILVFVYTFAKSGWPVGDVNPSVTPEYA